MHFQNVKWDGSFIPAGLLNVKHEITSIEVFHHKEKSLRGLEGAEQLQESEK